MTLQETAAYLRVNRSTIHRPLKRNAIPAFRIILVFLPVCENYDIPKLTVVLQNVGVWTGMLLFSVSFYYGLARPVMWAASLGDLTAIEKITATTYRTDCAKSSVRASCPELFQDLIESFSIAISIRNAPDQLCGNS